MLKIALAGAALILFCFASLSSAQEQPAKPPIIILKLDDVGHWLSPRWHRVADYLAEKKVKCSMGVIGEALEKIQPETVDFIHKNRDSGMIEFWLHGWHLRTPKETSGEWESGTEEEQLEKIERGEKLAQEKLGFTFAAFGPHWSATTDETEKALQASPEIRIWLYGPKQPKYFKKLSIPRVMGLENPTFVPDFAKFKDVYEKYGKKQSVLVLQGHPDQWADPDNKRWEGFKQIIDFLQGQGCTFMTPTEYEQSLSAK